MLSFLVSRHLTRCLTASWAGSSSHNLIVENTCHSSSLKK